MAMTATMMTVSHHDHHDHTAADRLIVRVFSVKPSIWYLVFDYLLANSSK